MTNDISNRQDIELMVNSFYEKVKKSPKIAHIFQMTDEQWSHHLPRMYNFWDNWVFETGGYTGGMMWVHLQTNEKHTLTWSHFEEWLRLFSTTVDALFVGEKADFVKNKASEIAQIMSAKIDYLNAGKTQKSQRNGT